MKIQNVRVAGISLDQATQARCETSQAVAEEYADAMKAGTKFPPVVIFRDSAGALRIGDGFTRATAAKLAGLQTIEAEIRDGGRREALEHSIRANAVHGQRFTNADKRRAVSLMLDDDEWTQLSDREIGRRSGVSDRLVNKLRAERSANRSHPDPLTEDERRKFEECTARIKEDWGACRTYLTGLREMRQVFGHEFFAVWLTEEGAEHGAFLERYPELLACVNADRDEDVNLAELFARVIPRAVAA